jgi:hypothetical protein
MVDLEEEFYQLTLDMYNKIRAKQVDGTLTKDEADALTRMVETQLDRQTDRVRAWQASSWCGDTAWDDSGCSY